MPALIAILKNLSKNPKVAAVFGGILGLVVGLIIGWVVWPVQYTDATPEVLKTGYQETYLRAAIDSYHVMKDIDPQVAAQEAGSRWNYLGASAVTVFLQIEKNPGKQNPVYIQDFRNVISQLNGPIEEPKAGPKTLSTAEMVISIAIILVLLVGVVWLFIFLRRLLGKRSNVVTPVMQAAEISRSVEKTNFESLGLAPPITQTMTTYVLGDDLYDESFSIDTQAGEFLGEYGIGVSETIGVGDPKKVTALEVWLFDKNDIKTATKVLMSEHAYNDQNIRSRLEPKGELVPIKPQEQVLLETQTLQLLATVVDLEYGTGPLPRNSYFERITLELAIWPKAAK